MNASSEGGDFKILVATDCHLGYAERDGGSRSNDSLTTFEEILSIAESNNVDFILLGGDLFHENKPSRKTLHGCMQLLRQYCMGGRPIQFEFLSDQSENFKHSPFPTVNYEDPNLNVSIPVFTIHGNHDDPCGNGSLSPVDLLSVSGLVNYFGQQKDLENIELSPLLLQKGDTKLAIYGLGAIREERVHRLFRYKRVKLFQPKEDRDAWFNVFVIHQNRAKHGATNYIPEEFIDPCMDLVVWGHEHECRIHPEPNNKQNFYVTQPGSSIVTSLCPGEAEPKHVGILHIRGKKFKLESIPLKTVRQFYLEDIDLTNLNFEEDYPHQKERAMEYCSERIDMLLTKARQERSGHAKQPKEPLIRLRIEYNDPMYMFSRHRLAQKYVQKVANPKDMIAFHYKRKKAAKYKGDVKEEEEEEMPPIDVPLQVLEAESVGNQIQEYFEGLDERSRLTMLPERSLSQALKVFVEKDDRDVIGRVLEFHLKKVQTHLKSNQVDKETIRSAIEEFKEHLNAKEIDDIVVHQAGTTASRGNGDVEDLDDISDSDMSVTATTVSRNSRRGRGSSAQGGEKQAGRGRGRARGSRARGGSNLRQTTLPVRRLTLGGDDSASDGESMSVSKRGKNRARKGKGVMFDEDDS